MFKCGWDRMRNIINCPVIDLVHQEAFSLCFMQIDAKRKTEAKGQMLTSPAFSGGALTHCWVFHS